jgi:hypothetical protein
MLWPNPWLIGWMLPYLAQEGLLTMKIPKTIKDWPKCQEKGCEGLALQVIDAKDNTVPINPGKWLMAKKPIVSRLYSGQCMKHFSRAAYQAVKMDMTAKGQLPLVSVMWV